MKWSKYNTITNVGDQKLLYNSLTNTFAEINNHQIELFDGLKKGTITKNDIDTDLFNQLVKAKILVENDDYEILRLKHETQLLRFDTSRLELTIIPTLDCNFDCKYCFETHQKINISEVVLDQIILYIKSIDNVKMISINWMGGEPLLAIDKIVSFTKKLETLNISFVGNLITNGYLLTNETINLLKKSNIIKVQVTIDGTERTHNARRPLKTGGETYSKILNNCIKLKKLYPEVRLDIRVNIDNENKNDFLILYNNLKNKIPNSTIYPAFVQDIGNTCTPMCNLDRSQQVNFINSLFEKYNFTEYPFYPLNESFECGIRGINNWVIGPEGELWKCWNHIGDKNEIIGYLDDRGLVNSVKYLQYISGADPYEDTQCLNCNVLPICKGGCPDLRIKKKYYNQNVDYCSKYKGNGLKTFLKTHYLSKHEKNN